MAFPLRSVAAIEARVSSSIPGAGPVPVAFAAIFPEGGPADIVPEPEANRVTPIAPVVKV
jgi:hypothetical protein